MKKLFFCTYFFLILINTNAQKNALLRNEIGIGVFGSSLKMPDKKFYIIDLHAEHRISLLKNKLGLGFRYTSVKNKNDANSEFAIGPILNYHLVSSGKFDPYLGISPVYSKRTNQGNPVGENFQLKYQYGARYFITNHIGFTFEISNYKFDGGLLPTDKQKRISGIFPTLGIQIKL
ncbi:hypothetical protein [Lacihabitans lacunae]|uniref:Outer membrane protein beta-barrel domain-containing protein n=1 Tax=Lacihabitans lacunae TaxID=1028214 RepID=A0ABV7YZX9_9BACT